MIYLIIIKTHALFRLVERGQKFGLNYFEARERAFQTVRRGKISKRKHKSRLTYYHYFPDNLSLYVICEKVGNKILIKSVIIEKGRE